MMGHLSKSPVASEDKLLVSGNAASNLLSLAAQIALEVGLITGLITKFCTADIKLVVYIVWEKNLFGPVQLKSQSNGIVMMLYSLKHMGTYF